MHFFFCAPQYPLLEKEMATHSSVLAWRIPGMREPGGLPSVGSHRVGHDWSNLVPFIDFYYSLSNTLSLSLQHLLTSQRKRMYWSLYILIQCLEIVDTEYIFRCRWGNKGNNYKCSSVYSIVLFSLLKNCRFYFCSLCF